MASERLRTFERDSFETIISLGYGHIYKEDQKYPKFQTLPKLEEEARKAIAGMWSICVTDALVEEADEARLESLKWAAKNYERDNAEDKPGKPADDSKRKKQMKQNR